MTKNPLSLASYQVLKILTLHEHMTLNAYGSYLSSLASALLSLVVHHFHSTRTYCK